jgi:transposase-like protein
MNSEQCEPKTLLEAIKFFGVYENAHNFIVQIRWQGGAVCCPNCGSTRVRYIQTRKQWECREQHPKRRFSLKTGTIMEDSPLPLEKWLAALWVEVNCKNSISSYEVHRDLGVTQKSAWFMLHRIRHAMHVGSFDKKLCGVVEADETLVGGLAKNMHKRKRLERVHGMTGGTHMTPVMGLLERHNGKKHSTVRTAVIPNRQKETLHAVIHKNVEPGSQIVTDSLSAYRGIDANFVHDFVDHAEAYVKDKVIHTNGLENFWSLFKRCIKGTHVSVSPCHLFRYVDSEAFRFNGRDGDDRSRFLAVANSISGKRLTYKALIASNGALEGGTAAAN